MGTRERDPMDQLLSSLEGIDSSRFQKPQAMKSQRSETSVPKKETSVSRGIYPGSSVQTHGVPASAGGMVSPRPQISQKSGGRASLSTGDSNSQLDSLLGVGLVSKASRPMREASKTSMSAQAPLQSPPSSSRTETTRQHSSALPEDLDAVFGTPGPSLGTHTPGQQSAVQEDPFDLFGGLGTTEKHESSLRGDDLLGGLVGSAGAGSVGPLKPQEQPSSPWEIRREARKSGGSVDWGVMSGAASPPPAERRGGIHDFLEFEDTSDPVRTSTSSATSSFQEASARSPPPARSQGGPPPPSYEAATRGSAARGSGVTSPKSSRVSSPRHPKVVSPRHSSYQAYKDGDSDELGGFGSGQSGSPGRRPRRTTSSERQRQGAERQEQAGREGDMKDQAKQWLSAGRDWLSGASKKVAQAVKETQAHINSRLEDSDAYPPRGSATSPRGASNGARGGRGQRAEGDSLQDIPQYYFEWAATIAALPGHEQGATLAAMPDEDATAIQRILRHRARRASMDATEDSMLEAAKRRSLSDEKLSQRVSAGPLEAGAARSHSSDLNATARDHRPQPTEHRPRPQSATARTPAPTARRPEPAQSQRPPPPQEDVDLMGLNLNEWEQAPTSPPSQAPPSRAPAQPAAGTDDLMGLNDSPKSASTPQVRSGVDEMDILGLSQSSGRGGGVASPTSQPARSNLDDLFDPTPPPTSQSRAGGVSPDLEELFGNRPTTSRPQASGRAGGGGDSMIDFGGAEAEVGAQHAELYQTRAADEEQEGEPEERKIARKKRLAAQHARMQKQLQEKVDRDRAEAQKTEAQHDLRAVHRERIEAWRAGKKDNIRALLSTLHTVLWENSGWQPLGMTDLVEPNRVKRSYMKANLVVHPDKVSQKGGSVEQIVIADMAFDALKTAFNKFESSELRR